MIKPAMPNIPGMSAVTETMDFVKNLWGGMSTPGLGIPGMVMPTLSVDEIDKQIKDLKAVESWLNVNMSMLRGTIQALEVQSATISTLQSMGQSLTAAVSGGKAAPLAPSRPFAAAAAAAAAAKAEEAEALKAAAEAASAAASAAKEEVKKTAARKKARADLKEEFSAAGVGAKLAAAVSANGKDNAAANPALWWNMLQDQFKQAVSTAMAPEAMGAMAKNAMGKAVGAAAKAAVKPVAKAAGKTVIKKVAAKRKAPAKK